MKREQATDLPSLQEPLRTCSAARQIVGKKGGEVVARIRIAISVIGFQVETVLRTDLAICLGLGALA